MNKEILGYILGVVMFALSVTVIVLAATELTKKKEKPVLLAGGHHTMTTEDGRARVAEPWVPPPAPPPIPLPTWPQPETSDMTMSSFGSPNDLLEEEYLKTLNFVERLYHKTLSASDKQTRLAKFSISKPELLGNILDKFKNQ